jgi:DNA-directed RNA polymerase subunit RPC12/RpoP
VGSAIKIAFAIAIFLLIMKVGLTVLRSLAQPPPEPPPPGELRKVKLTYRCSICGTEVRMTVAPHEDPEPPRHCQEDMELVAPID